MSKTKIWLITAASLILAGCLIFGGLMTFMKWDFNKLSTTKYETNEYEIIDSYNNISIITNTSDVIFVPSDKTSIVCYEEEKLNHSVTVKDGTLIIEREITGDEQVKDILHAKKILEDIKESLGIK